MSDPATNPDSEPLRIGILGAANICKTAIVDPAHEAGARLVAVGARDRGRAEAFAVAHGVERVLDDYQAVVDDPEVEVIYNALPNGMHAPWNMRAAAAGKHVLTEKPSCANSLEARRVQAVVDESGIYYMEALHYRYHPMMDRVLGLIRSGELGTITRVEARTTINPPADDDLRMTYSLAGGSLMDLGSYALHVQRTIGQLLGGEPTVTTAEAEVGPPGIDMRAIANLGFPGGATGLSTTDMTGEQWQFTLSIVGTDGEAFVHRFIDPHDDNRLTVSTSDGTRLEQVGGTRTTFCYQFDALRALLREGIAVPTDAEDAARNMELIDAVYLAAGLEPRPSLH